MTAKANVEPAPETSKTDAPWPASGEASSVRGFRRMCVYLILIFTVVSVTVLAGLWFDRRDARNTTTEALSTASDATDTAYAALIEARDYTIAQQVQLESESRSNSSTPASIDAARTALEDAGNAQGAAQGKYDAARTEVANATTAKARAASALHEVYTYAFIALGLLIGIVVTAVTAYRWFEDSRRLSFESRLALEAVRDADREAARGTDPLALKTMWANNRQRLEAYHTLVTAYAASTRATTRIALAVGLIFVILAGLAAAIAPTVASSVTTGAVGVIGAGLTAYIATAVLRNSESSSREVLAFFSHPLELERVLSAERIADQLGEAEQATARLLIIKALVAQTSGGQAPTAEPRTPAGS
ncbi:hypothetical protein [Kribbella sp. VKM Ac-2569]|uniref:hypothetical protein n=1 Tax=Kribbella sp. VKM Ac-2569 TaxID=2512220 RepID=UPI00102C382C|nr:hypothetical protein [Kribbella sp. VKM Ac-2569]